MPVLLELAGAKSSSTTRPSVGWGYRYLDWLLTLAKEYDLHVWDRVGDMKEKTMPYVTVADREVRKLGQAKGRIEG